MLRLGRKSREKKSGRKKQGGRSGRGGAFTVESSRKTILSRAHTKNVPKEPTKRVRLSGKRRRIREKEEG